MARSRCFYTLIIICPYLFMIFMFYREIQQTENSRRASLELSELSNLRFDKGTENLPSIHHVPQSLHPSNLFESKDKNVQSVRKQRKSNLKKPEMSKLQVKIKPKVIKKRQTDNEIKSSKKRSKAGKVLSNQKLGNTSANPDENILLGGVMKRLSSKSVSTTLRYQVPKPLLNKKKSCLENEGPVDKTNYGFHNISNAFVFSVFYDNRNGERIIRVIILKNRTDDRRLMCGFSKNGHLYIVPSEKYEMCENHEKKFGGWILSCSVPPQIKVIPCQVYLSFTIEGFKKKHTNSVLKLNVTMATKSDDESLKKDFGLCIPPVFGEVSIITLVQFIELSKILGVSGITFYHTKSSPADVDEVLKYYQGKGEVTVIPWLLPMNLTEKDLWYYGQILAVEDCLYRNMARYKYLAFNDMDEFIVPQNNATWIEMVEEIFRTTNQSNDARENIAGFSFKSAFFSPNQPIDPTYKIRFLQFLYRTKTFSSIRNKIMVRPEKVFEVGIHHLSRPMGEAVTIEVDPKLAYLHHYRACSIDYDSAMKCQPVVQDLSLLKYSADLQANYMKAMDEIVSVLYAMQGAVGT